MRKLYLVLALFLCALCLVGCRKNESKTLEIVSHSGSTYKIKSLDDSIKYGKLFIIVKDEKLVSFEVELNKNYTYSSDSYIKIGSYYAEFSKSESNNKVTLTITNPLNLVVSEDGKEVGNSNEVKLYFKALDKDNNSSTTTLNITPKDLVEFIRNKSL